MFVPPWPCSGHVIPYRRHAAGDTGERGAATSGGYTLRLANSPVAEGLVRPFTQRYESFTVEPSRDHRECEAALQRGLTALEPGLPHTARVQAAAGAVIRQPLGRGRSLVSHGPKNPGRSRGWRARLRSTATPVLADAGDHIAVLLSLPRKVVLSVADDRLLLLAHPFGELRWRHAGIGHGPAGTPSPSADAAGGVVHMSLGPETVHSTWHHERGSVPVVQRPVPSRLAHRLVH
jgi:hypothetical protein